MMRILDMPAALRHLSQIDPRLAALIAQHGPPRLARTRNTFRSLARAIIFQQLSGRAAETIYRRFVALYPGRRFPQPGEVLTTPISQLRSAGLSGQKAGYLQDLAAKYTDGTLQPRRFAQMSDEEIGQALIQVKGIGQWSVDMFLIFALNRPDVLPVSDLGVRKGFQRFFQLPALPLPDEMRLLAEPWRPYRSVGTWYMWRVVEAGMPDV